MLLDADAIIVDHSVRFDDVIQKARKTNPRAEAILSTCKQCIAEKISDDELLSLNAGVMLVHNSRWSEQWIKNLYMTLLKPQLLEFNPAPGSPLPGNVNPFHDNWAIYLNLLFEPAHKKRIVFVDHSVFNSQPHDPLPSGGWDSFIVHLAGFSYWHPEIENKYAFLAGVASLTHS